MTLRNILCTVLSLILLLSVAGCDYEPGVYKDKRYGFSFKIPPNWVKQKKAKNYVIFNPQDKSFSVIYNATLKIEYEISGKTVLPLTTYEEIIKEIKEGEKGSVLDEGMIMLDNQDAKFIIIRNNKAEVLLFVVAVYDFKRLYKIYCRAVTYKDFLKFKKDFEAVLASFKFIKR